MTVSITAYCYKNENLIHTQLVELNSIGYPPDKITHDGKSYGLLVVKGDKARYMALAELDPECICCHKKESEAGKFCGESQTGIHDFDDIPF